MSNFISPKNIILILVGLATIYFFFGKKKEKENYEPVLTTKLNLNSNNIDNDLRRKTKYVRLTYGRPNKCFSCEKDILKNAGPKYIHYAFPSKCFSCERESKRPYMEGPTKCFACDKEKNIY